MIRCIYDNMQSLTFSFKGQISPSVTMIQGQNWAPYKNVGTNLGIIFCQGLNWRRNEKLGVYDFIR